MKEKEMFLEFIKAYDLQNIPFEIRILNSNKYGIQSGYYNDLDKAYQDISNLWQKYTCYFTLQEINPMIVARNENHLSVTKTVTSDVDILAYRFLHIDIDPTRPSGIQSTNKESRVAIKRLMLVTEFLKDNFGFPKPIIVFSGNGVTADYKVQKIRVNDENKKVIHDCLEVLSALFSDDKAKVDTTVFNPARIIKIPGTISAKGSNTEDRPHRLSEILTYPDKMEEVSIKQLQDLASVKEEMLNG
jgi:hypothetical protein